MTPPPNRDPITIFRHASGEWLGEFGEKVWANVFAGSGLRYLPLSKINDGGAPMMRGDNGKIVLPDFSINNPGWTAFVDSKCKKNVVLYRHANELRHGIDARNWAEYERAGVAECKPCGIGIVELFGETCGEWSGSLLIESLTNLGKPFAGFSNQSHMVYWPRKRFADLDSLTPAELMDIAAGRLKPNHRHALVSIFSKVEARTECPYELHQYQPIKTAAGVAKQCTVCGKVTGHSLF